MGLSLTSTLSKRNLGVQPWNSLENIEDSLDTGDIVIFSTRSFTGRAIRFHQQSFWSHCGMIVRIPYSKQVLIMDCCVERESLWTCKVSCNKRSYVLKISLEQWPFSDWINNSNFAIKNFQWWL